MSPSPAASLLTADPSTLAGRCVLLAGATGAVGTALLDRLVALGARPAVAVRKSWQVQGIEARIGAAAGLVGVVPTGDGEAAAGFVKGAQDSLGAIEAFVSTAGSFRAAEIGRDRGGDDQELFDANFRGTHTLLRAVVGGMRRRRRGAIVLTGALAVGRAGPGIALYAATKAALHEYARVLAAEVGADGVGLALLAPGTIDTEANRRAMPDADRRAWIPVEVLVDALLGAAAGAAPVAAVDPCFTLAEA